MPALDSPHFDVKAWEQAGLAEDLGKREKDDFVALAGLKLTT